MKTCETPISQIESTYAYFHDPANSANIQRASDKTQYVWQHMSGYYPTEQVLRDGPIHELPGHIDPAIGKLNVEFSDGTTKTADEYFETSTMDAMLVLRGGSVVFERDKAMRPFDQHNWFSCTKSTVAVSLALLEHEGKVDVMKPVSHYLPELAGSEWDTVTVEQTLDMATGLDSTEHEEEDARTNPARGWYKWAASLDILPDVLKLHQTPFEVLRSMQRRKPGYTVFEYNSINTFVVNRIVEQVTGQPLNEVFANRIWRKIGAEHDAYVVVSPQGHALHFGFMNRTLRDMARFGMLFTPSGSKISKERVIPEKVVKMIQTTGHPDIYAGGYMGVEMHKSFPDEKDTTNRYQWDAIFTDGDMYKKGVGCLANRQVGTQGGNEERRYGTAGTAVRLSAFSGPRAWRSVASPRKRPGPEPRDGHEGRENPSEHRERTCNETEKG